MDDGGGARSRQQRSSITSAIAVLTARFSKGPLYGRDQEQEEILKVYNRVKCETTSDIRKAEFILIQGGSGTGKSALVDIFLAKLVAKDGGYCVTGKFDQLIQLHEPHSAFVEAITSYAETVIERGEVDIIRAALEQSENEIEGVDLLVKMIPALAKVIMPKTNDEKWNDDSVNEDSSADFGSGVLTEALSRFKYAFQLFLRLFLRVIASRERLLVFVLEDLHWADEAAFDLLKTLLTDTLNQETLFVATYRDDADTEKVSTMLKQLQKCEVSVSHIFLKNLDEAATSNMVVEVLQTNSINGLANLLFSHTKGNPYFISLFLQALVEGRFLSLDMGSSNSNQMQWSCDPDEIRVEFGDTIRSIVTHKISQLPSNVLKILRFASCLGSKIDAGILGHLMGESSAVVSSCLNLAAEQGLLVNSSGPRSGWTFAHDAIQDATLCLIPMHEREELHYWIGRRLWRCFDLNELDQKIFVVVGQLMDGSEFVTEERERIAVAKLCLRAGERSVYMSSFQSAYKYIVHGIKLIGRRCWQDNYALSLDLYNAAAEVGFCTGRVDEVYVFVGEILMHAECLEDILRGIRQRYTL